jgi:hypothetical protein
LRRLGFASQRVKQREALRRDAPVVDRRADRASGLAVVAAIAEPAWPSSGRISTNASGSFSGSA